MESPEAARCCLPKKQNRVVASPIRRDMEAKDEASANRRPCDKTEEE
jgi:hypothetical protein